MAKLLAGLQILMLPKGYDYSFNSYLHSSEADCKCNRKTCHFTLINPDLVQKFYEIRYHMNRPLKVNSLFRCQEHNKSKKVNGVDHSSHTTGNAIDISTRNLAPQERENLIDLCNERFDYTILYPTFIHCQING